MSIKHKCKETDDPFVIKEKDAYTSEILDTLKSAKLLGWWREPFIRCLPD
jgi:hypothetical protein